MCLYCSLFTHLLVYIIVLFLGLYVAEEVLESGTESDVRYKGVFPYLAGNNQLLCPHAQVSAKVTHITEISTVWPILNLERLSNLFHIENNTGFPPWVSN